MRTPFLPPPTLEDLELLEVHELVRDYPELLSLFRQKGVRAKEDGTSRIPSAFFPGAGEEGSLFGSLAWRE